MVSNEYDNILFTKENCVAWFEQTSTKNPAIKRNVIGCALKCKTNSKLTFLFVVATNDLHYGIVLDGVFFGESMFHYERDASKIAFVLAIQHLKNIGIKMVDCQMKTNHLLSLGAKEISRDQFIQLLNTYIKT